MNQRYNELTREELDECSNLHVSVTVHKLHTVQVEFQKYDVSDFMVECGMFPFDAVAHPMTDVY